MMRTTQAPLSRRGELLRDVPLAGYTSWRVGGRARRLYRPADRADLLQFLRDLAPDEPLLWLGLGSNLLVRDGGFPGTVILARGCLEGLRRSSADGIQAEAGVSCAKLARFAARADLTGAEFLAGIPGTLGGALAMNAGAFGGETWPLVQAVETVDRTGEVRRRPPADYRIGYREVQGPAGEWFLGASLILRPGDVSLGQARIRGLLERRATTQPIGLPSGGSTFCNPPGDHAARLIEAAGLKGLRRGGAEVSPKHANFIINRGGARAADIEALIEQIQVEVERRFGVSLVPEVQRVGVSN
jgi:UDP-N-acetylmuramate dehydrogenase